VGLLTLILLSPIYNALFFDNIGKSLALYFINFEFNASIFYVLKHIGMWVYGYDMIRQFTPFLTTIVVFFILKKTFFTKPNETISWDTVFFDDCLMVISVYFACATTVHPWYAALPLAISVFTTWRFPIVWTFFILLTYGNYTEGSSKHAENYWIVFLEYLMVYGFFIWEWYNKRKAYRALCG
jgi:alpha-1,6-mannosyltransferase